MITSPAAPAVDELEAPSNARTAFDMDTPIESASAQNSAPDPLVAPSLRTKLAEKTKGS